MRFINLLWLALVLGGCATRPPAPAVPASDAAPKHFLWHVDGGDNTVWLLGSVHLLRPEVYPLPAPINAAYEEAALIVFELDLDAVQAEAAKMLQRGTYPPGKTLQTELGEDTWRQVEAALTDVGMSPQLFQRMEPWFVALTLTALKLQQAGFADSTGIDAHFFRRARAAGKERRALETLDEQITIFDEMGATVQEAFLQSTLSELSNLSAEMDALTALWQRGDAPGLEARALDELRRTPALYDALLLERNRRWVPDIEALIAGEQDALVVVGALHLVGDDGVVAMLRERGYAVTQR